MCVWEEKRFWKGKECVSREKKEQRRLRCPFLLLGFGGWEKPHKETPHSDRPTGVTPVRTTGRWAQEEKGNRYETRATLWSDRWSLLALALREGEEQEKEKKKEKERTVGVGEEMMRLNWWVWVSQDSLCVLFAGRVQVMSVACEYMYLCVCLCVTCCTEIEREREDGLLQVMLFTEIDRLQERKAIRNI